MYGVTEKAIAYRVQMSPDSHGNTAEMHTEQLSLASRVSQNTQLEHRLTV